MNGPGVKRTNVNVRQINKTSWILKNVQQQNKSYCLPLSSSRIPALHFYLFFLCLLSLFSLFRFPFFCLGNEKAGSMGSCFVPAEVLNGNQLPIYRQEGCKITQKTTNGFKATYQSKGEKKNYTRKKDSF